MRQVTSTWKEPQLHCCWFVGCGCAMVVAGTSLLGHRIQCLGIIKDQSDMIVHVPCICIMLIDCRPDSGTLLGFFLQIWEELPGCVTEGRVTLGAGPKECAAQTCFLLVGVCAGASFVRQWILGMQIAQSAQRMTIGTRHCRIVLRVVSAAVCLHLAFEQTRSNHDWDFVHPNFDSMTLNKINKAWPCHFTAR